MNSRNLKELKARSKYVTEEVKIKNNALKFVASTFNYASAASEARTFSKPNSHGFFSESLVEAQARFEGKSAEIMNSMGRSWKNRGDVMIDGEEVQVKVHATTKSTYAALTDGHGGQRYLNDDGSNMKIAVASDQVEALRDQGMNVQSIGYTADELKNFHSSGAGIEWAVKDAIRDVMSSPSVLVGMVRHVLLDDYITERVAYFGKIFLSKTGLFKIEKNIANEDMGKLSSLLYRLLGIAFSYIGMSVIFKIVMKVITLLSSKIGLTIFGFSSGGFVLAGITGVFALANFALNYKKAGMKDAALLLFETSLLVSVASLISPLVSSLLGLILTFKDKVVKGFKTLYDYLVSLFR